MSTKSGLRAVRPCTGSIRKRTYTLCASGRVHAASFSAVREQNIRTSVGGSRTDTKKCALWPAFLSSCGAIWRTRLDVHLR